MLAKRLALAAALGLICAIPPALAQSVPKNFPAPPAKNDEGPKKKGKKPVKAGEQQPQESDAAAAERQQQIQAERAQKLQALEAQKAARAKKIEEQRLKVQEQRAKAAAEGRLRAEQQKAAAEKKRAEQLKTIEAQRESIKARQEKAKADAERLRLERKANADTQAAERKAKAEALAAERKAKADGLAAEREAARSAAQKKREEDIQARSAAAKAAADEAARQRAAASAGRIKPPKGVKRAVVPVNDTLAKEAIRRERLEADQEFERAKRRIQTGGNDGRDATRFDTRAAARFEDVRRKRTERAIGRGVAIIEEPDQRTIVRRKDRAYVRNDDRNRLTRTARELRRERQRDGTTLIINIGLNGVEIHTVEDQYGRILRRYRRYGDGREVVIIDNRRFYERRREERFIDAFVDVALPLLAGATSRYVLDYDRASDDEIYDILVAPPVEPLPRRYYMEEIRQNYALREYMPRVDLDTINFAFASWDVEPDQYPRLERIARIMNRIIDRNPDEVFMIEGHTDAVGSDIDNLSLSDRRAEMVATILSEEFRVPPENLVTQGYGEEFLKIDTYGPSRANRRVAVRRITPLLERDDRYSGR